MVIYSKAIFKGNFLQTMSQIKSLSIPSYWAHTETFETALQYICYFVQFHLAGVHLSVNEEDYAE